MSDDLRIDAVDDATLEDWQHVDNVIIATDGLRFARAHGFVDEVDRYLPEGDVHPFITLRLR